MVPLPCWLVKSSFFKAKKPLGVEGWNVLLHRSDHLSSVIAAISDHGGFPVGLVAPKAYVFQLEPGLRYQLTCYGAFWSGKWNMEALHGISQFLPFVHVEQDYWQIDFGCILFFKYVWTTGGNKQDTVGLNVGHQGSKDCKQGSFEIYISHGVCRVNHTFTSPHHMVSLPLLGPKQPDKTHQKKSWYHISELRLGIRWMLYTTVSSHGSESTLTS